jgi:PTH1 family peptidyl-tRNA hydrolase
MKLIVGLGNPGLKYMFSRHNAGFWVVDKIATTCGAHYERAAKLFCDLAKINLGGQQVIIAKPDTYMNESGKAVQAILNWYKIDLAELMVVHDDVALPLGKLRFQNTRGAGGQHGIEDIIQMLGGTTQFDRLKFGVGPDPGGDRRADYLLSPLSEADRPLRDQMIELCARALNVYLDKGIQVAMNEFNNIDLRPPPPESPPKPAGGPDPTPA